MTNPIDPGRGASTVHVPADQPQLQQTPEGQTERHRVQAVAATSTKGLKTRFLSCSPIDNKWGTRMSILVAKPFARLAGFLRGEQLPHALKTAINNSDGQLFRETVEQIAPFKDDKRDPNLTAEHRDDRMHERWLGCRMNGEPPLFYLAKRGNYAIAESICQNPSIGFSSLEWEPVAGSQPRLIPGDLNKKGLAGYEGSPFAFALDNGNFDTALAMAENGGTLQQGGAKEVFRDLNLTSDERSDFLKAFTVRLDSIEGALDSMTNEQAQVDRRVQEMKEQYGQLIGWENPNFANFDDYPEPELKHGEWDKISTEFARTKNVSDDLICSIRLLQAQCDNVKADLKLLEP